MRSEMYSNRPNPTLDFPLEALEDDKGTRIQCTARLPNESREIKKPKSLTDGGIVYTVNNDLLDSGSLEFFLLLKVPRNLLCGSRGGECTGKTNDNDVLSGTIIRNIDLLHVGKSLHDLNRGEGGESHLSDGKGLASKGLGGGEVSVS